MFDRLVQPTFKRAREGTTYRRFTLFATACHFRIPGSIRNGGQRSGDQGGNQESKGRTPPLITKIPNNAGGIAPDMKIMGGKQGTKEKRKQKAAINLSMTEVFHPRLSPFE